MRARLQWALLPLALGACATAPAPLTSSLPAAGAPVAHAGAPAHALAAAAVEPALDALHEELEALDGWGTPVALRLVREGGGLRLSLDADDSFPPGSAVLRPGALSTYAGLANALAARPGLVAHIRVPGELSPEPATSLPARRAASLQAYLAARGVPGTRLRSQGEDAGSAAAVEVQIKPIVIGREPEAWVPPS